MLCPNSPAGIHRLVTPFPGKNIRHCMLCNKWLLSSREQIVPLPPPSVLAATAPVRDPDARLGEIVEFTRIA